MTATPYQLVRSAKRRTISLQVKAGQVRVLAPIYVPKSEIDLLVQQKSAWIQKKIKLQGTLSAKPVRDFVDGDELYYLGKPYILKVSLANTNSVRVAAPYLEVSIHAEKKSYPLIAEQVKSVVEQWYLQQAQVLLSNRVTSLQEHTGLFGSSLTIKHYKTRWGSCDNKQRIKLNWLLVMAPIEMIDYVIIHELCHLRYLNHSNQFWTLVKSFYPNVQQAKLWFKTHQEYLYWQSA